MTQPVTIYTTPTCGYCRSAKDFMREHNVTFQEIDVSADIQKAREMIEKSGQMGVPVITIGTAPHQEVIVGYDRARLSQAFGASA